jgi:hypothetical protein
VPEHTPSLVNRFLRGCVTTGLIVRAAGGSARQVVVTSLRGGVAQSAGVAAADALEQRHYREAIGALGLGVAGVWASGLVWADGNPGGSSSGAEAMNLPNLEPRNQFLLGALAGSTVVYVLTSTGWRRRLMRSAVKAYLGVASGAAELREQVSDIKAELDAELDAERKDRV